MTHLVSDDTDPNSIVPIAENDSTSRTAVPPANQPRQILDTCNAVSAALNNSNCEYRSFNRRLLTFSSYPRKKPTSLELAHAGFISVGDGDAVACPICKIEIRNFEQAIDCVAYHKTYSKRCTFLDDIGDTTLLSCSDGARQKDGCPLPLPQPSTCLMEPIDHSGLVLAQECPTKYDKYKMIASQHEESDMEKLANESDPHTFDKDDMKVERCRQKSLTGRGFIEREASKQLASRGLYFESGLKNNMLKCIFCDFNIEVKGNSPYRVKEILSKHASGSCTPVRNVPDVWNPHNFNNLESASSDLGIIRKEAKFPQMAVQTRREATFLTYPSNFLEGIIQEYGSYTPPTHESRLNTVTTRMLRPRLDSIAVQKALDMGLSRNHLRQVVGNRIKRGEPDFKYVADIVREVKALTTEQAFCEDVPLHLPTISRPPVADESEEEGLPNDMVWLRWSSPDVQNSLLEVLGEDRMNSVTEKHQQGGAGDNVNLAYVLRMVLGDEPEETAAAEDTTPAENIETFRAISSQLTCKICLDAVIGVIFLPCGHLVSCGDCAAAMVNCPLCRQEIKGIIRASIPYRC